MSGWIQNFDILKASTYIVELIYSFRLSREVGFQLAKSKIGKLFTQRFCGVASCIPTRLASNIQSSK